MTPSEIIRAAIPSATDDLCDHILWGRTTFPASTSAKTLYRAASRFSRAKDKGQILCDHCDNIALEKRFICLQCHDFITQVRNT